MPTTYAAFVLKSARWFLQDLHSSYGRIAGVSDLPRPPDSDDALKDYLDRNYEYLKKHAAPEVVHFAAVCLAAFGDPDVFEDILDGIPRGAKPAGPLQFAINLGKWFPIPKSLSPVDDTEAVRAWFRANRHLIHWAGDNEGRYVLDEHDTSHRADA